MENPFVGASAGRVEVSTQLSAVAPGTAVFQDTFRVPKLHTLLSTENPKWKIRGYIFYK